MGRKEDLESFLLIQTVAKKAAGKWLLVEEDDLVGDLCEWWLKNRRSSWTQKEFATNLNNAASQIAIKTFQKNFPGHIHKLSQAGSSVLDKNAIENILRLYFQGLGASAYVAFVEEYFATISERDVDMLRQRYFEGKTMKQIALPGETENRVKNIIHSHVDNLWYKNYAVSGYKGN